MSLASGTRLGPYEIVSQIGVGGMGEVYKATDTRLQRTIAIKVLPGHLADDPQRLARFQREAQTISSLNHPYICALHDVGDESGIRFLVMEYVEGQTLEHRLESGPLPLDDALEYAGQIADALVQAHQQGIVHRDLKPGNVMITSSGVKLLDFGLAKLSGDAEQSTALSQAPTEGGESLTEEGTILGTFRYMAPEQLEGKDIDARTDIYALCLVLYEMITARQVFDATTQASLIAAILKDKPRPLTELQPITPPQLDRVVQTGLEKDPDKRWQSAREVKHALEWIGLEAPAAPAAGVDTRALPAWRAATVALLAVVVALAFSADFGTPPSPRELRLEIDTPRTSSPESIAISPDGRMLAFVADGSEAGSQLWLQFLETGVIEPLPRTEGASLPFWSPDSRAIGFFADQQLKRIDLEGGVVRRLADAPVGAGGSWSADQVILFAPTESGAIFQVSAEAGGAPTAVTQLAGRTAHHTLPRLLPDGRHFLYRVDAAAVHLASLDRPEAESSVVVDEADLVDFRSGSEELIFQRQGTLFAQTFDLSRLALLGDPLTIAVGAEAVALSVSADGPIVYRSGSVGSRRRLAWYDRSGAEVETVLGPSDAGFEAPEISPGGDLVALQYDVSGDLEIGLLNLATGRLSNLTNSPRNDSFPLWSRSGDSILFGSERAGTYDVYEQSINGESATRVLQDEPNSLPMDVRSDGAYLLYRPLAESGYDLWAVPLDGDSVPVEVVATPANEREGRLSPDGQWLAYQSDEESGRFEIYLRPFPPDARRAEQVSFDGGTQVRWRSDGQELFFIGLDGWLTAVSIESPSPGDSIGIGSPERLFPTSVGGALQGYMRQQYDVSLDGQRFLMSVIPDTPDSSPITVILNWNSDVE